MILADLRTHLLSFVDLTTKIADRIYISRAPRGAKPPYLILSRISGTPQYSLSGEVGVTQAIVQVTAWARDPNGPFVANVVAELVRDKLSHWRGNWGDTFVSDCTLENEPIDLSEVPNDGSDEWWHGVDQTYQVTHRRAVPTLS